MNEIPKFAAPQDVTAGPIAGSRKVYASPRGWPDIRVPFREIRAQRPERAAGQGLRPVRPLYRERAADRSRPRPEAGARILARSSAATPRSRGARSGRRTTAPSRPIISRRCARRSARSAQAARASSSPNSNSPAPAIDHRGDDLCRPSREPRARGGGRGGGRADRRRRELRGRDPRVRDAGVRAQRGGARARDHSGQHQPRRARADGDRPQFPRQGQRQHRQFGGELGRRRGGREDGVGDPLGRRHGHGPLDRPQHPQHPLLDRAQFAGPDRHGADLPGAGEGRRRPAQARLGGVQGHADRAGGAGRRLFHHPRRRAARLCAADGQARDRHRLARRLDHGALVPRRPPRELPLRALRRHLRHHAQIRRLVLARRRLAAGLDRRRQRRGAIRRARDAWASSPRSPGTRAAR